LDAATTGYQNVAIGVNAATASTGTVYSNTVVGANAATAMTSGVQNTSIGAGASQLGTSASQTTSVGAGSLLRLSTGSENTSMGYLAGQNITSGIRNVTIGSVAGQGISTGGHNVCIGWNAGNDITTGSRNICIGQNPETGSAVAFDRIVMGYDVVGGVNDSFLIGRGTIDSQIAFGATSITAPSDIRLKEDIKDEEVGLEFIKDLRPVTFLWKKEKDIPKDMRAYKEGSEERTMNGKYNHGFIAQEVKEVIDKHNLKEGFDMWSEDDTDGRQRVAPAALISVMVKAIQELSAEVEKLKSQIGV